MESDPSLSPQVLDEDLRIIRATLATLTGAVHRHSQMAGVALENALAQLDLAQDKIAESLRGQAARETFPGLPT